MKRVKKYLLMLMTILLIPALSGCGVSHGTAAGVVKSLVESYADGKEKKARDCFGKKDDADAALLNEIDAMIAYMRAHGTKKVKIVDTGVMSSNDTYSYMYITYNLILEDEREYPCIGTYMVEKIDRKYYVVPTAEVTESMSEQAVTDYQEFMTTDAYKEYRRAYDNFVKDNSDYEEELAGKLG